MNTNMITTIRKNLQSLDRKLDRLQDDNDRRIAYDYATNIRNGIVALHYDSHFGEPGIKTAASITCCNGYVDQNGIAVLSVADCLPHTKNVLTATVKDHWESCVHAATNSLAESSPVPFFQRAHIGIHAAFPKGINNSRIWDSCNRAINLVINNLKGTYFPDDSIEHMMFSVRGSWAEKPVTKIYIGDFACHSEEIMGYLHDAV